MLSKSLCSLAFCIAIGIAAGTQPAVAAIDQRARPCERRAKSKSRPSLRGLSIRGACNSCQTAVCWSPSGWGACVLSTRMASSRRRFFEGLPEVAAVGQGGLLDVLLAPDFAKSGIIYLSYGEPREDGKNGTSVARAKLVFEGDGARLEDVKVIFPATASRQQRASFRLAPRLGEGRHAVRHHGRAQQAARSIAEPGQRHRQDRPHQCRRLDPRRQSKAARLGAGGLVDRPSQRAGRRAAARHQSALHRSSMAPKAATS